MRANLYLKSVLTVVAVCLVLIAFNTFHVFRWIPWIHAAAEARASAEPHAISYLDFLTVLLTALGVMLAILALGIGALAIWGYTGLRESLTANLADRADAVLQAKLKEYPEAAEMVALKSRVDAIEHIHERMVDNPPIEPLTRASEHSDIVDAVQPLKVRDYPPEIGS